MSNKILPYHTPYSGYDQLCVIVMTPAIEIKLNNNPV